MGRSVIESDARLTGVQFKREAKLFYRDAVATKHADCRLTFTLYM